ncbi:MAG: sensor domain-containing diguanylate cyclase [Deltaproteobacteria bacterium]|nr:sensor domain-containing diguanylate cyclase [Deltaproteobacteria bacterium]
MTEAILNKVYTSTGFLKRIFLVLAIPAARKIVCYAREAHRVLLPYFTPALNALERTANKVSIWISRLIRKIRIALRPVSEYLRGRFLKMNMAKKMLLAYFPLAVLLILISVFTLFSFKRINAVMNSMLYADVAVIEVTNMLTDTLIDQETYGHRYLILKNPDMLKIYKEKSEEFANTVSVMAMIPDSSKLPIKELSTLHHEYDKFFKNIFHASENGLPTATFERKADLKRDELVVLLKKLTADTLKSQNAKIQGIADFGSNAFVLTAGIGILGLIIGIGAALYITKNISTSIEQLKIGTRNVANGNFLDIPKVESEDELGDLSVAFMDMANRLKRLEEMYLDASPLTRLPGGIAIENVLKKRVEANLPVAFCFADIDNFKAYNDRHGYAKGSELILAVSKIMKDVIRDFGTSEDFLGHIGGDDFVMITTPARHDMLCTKIIDKFDMAIPFFYTEEEVKQGYIDGKSRQGQKMKFPLATLSIAVVTNKLRRITNHIEYGEIAAELKEFAKSIPKSAYVVDKRTNENIGYAPTAPHNVNWQKERTT